MPRKTVLLTAAVVILQMMSEPWPAPTCGCRGAGATFPNPFYQRLVAEFQKLHPDVKIDYASIGSGGGIKGITEKTIDFAGSDAPMNKKEVQAAGGADVLVEIPTCAGGVVPGLQRASALSKELNFTGGKSLADIYLGKITKWERDPGSPRSTPA